MPLEFRKALIMLIFNSDSDFTVRYRSIADLARTFHISENSIHSVLKAFRDQGSDLKTFCDRRKAKKTPFSYIPASV